MAEPLAEYSEFNGFSLLVLNERGFFIELGDDLARFSDAQEVDVTDLKSFFDRRVVLPTDVTDVFIWVHGWQNDLASAVASGRRIFGGILDGFNERRATYSRLEPFRPAFVIVHWPSQSMPGRAGYKRIRERAKEMTESGCAEFFLAALLGYLETQKATIGDANGALLHARGGYAVHCIGHSFGGRFLSAAIQAAASPQSPQTLWLLDKCRQTPRGLLSAFGGEAFEYTVDSFTVFQMAAPNKGFSPELEKLVHNAPLRGPITLTHSTHDAANCVWHLTTEFEPGIGCTGALQPVDYLTRIKLREVTSAYGPDDFSQRIINVDASGHFSEGAFPQGSHSDIFYDVSVHLLLSLANFVR